MYEQLLVALDGSRAAERVLEHAEAIASAFGSHITLLRATLSAEVVVAESSAGETPIGQVSSVLDPEQVIEADQSTTIEYLESVANRLRQQGLHVSTEDPPGPAEAVIVERAAALGAGLILMTTHGRSGLGRMVFGSVAESVLRHASCPVLVVRIGDAHGHVKSP
jgi:nucleotide-binding universal stress UspA family protein